MFMSNSSNNESVAKSQPGPGSTGIKVGSYNILGTLGHGNFSVCKLARHTITNHQVAIKCIEKKNLDQTSSMRIYREIEIMKSLDHQNIVKLDQVMESKSMIYLVCEYAERGDIFDYISKNGPMNENLACKKFCQILSAVEYCHLRNIVHRDLKSENLLLDLNMNIKLADFGFSNHFDLINPLKTFCGSPPYAAPEVFCGKKFYGPEVDIWSLGVILYVLISASLPFDSDNLQQIKQRVISGKFRVPYFISQECEHLISHILVVNTSKRFKLQQIKTHKWIKSNNQSYYYNSNKTGSQFSNKQSFDLETDPEASNASLKVERDKFQSKSLKLTGHKQRAKNNMLADQKRKLTLSSVSLPLYSFEDCHTGSLDSILTDAQDAMLSAEQCSDVGFSTSALSESKQMSGQSVISNTTLMDFKNMAIIPKAERSLNRSCVKPQESFVSSCASSGETTGTTTLNSNNNNPRTKDEFQNKILVHMDSITAYSDLLSHSSSLDESVDSGISSTPLTSSSYSFCSTNPLTNNLQKFRELKSSQNSLDHYSNHPSNYTRKNKVNGYARRNDKIYLFKKAFKIPNSKSSGKSTHELSLHELNNLKLSIGLRHSVCEDELNEVVAQTKESRRSFKYKVKVDEAATSDIKIILNESEETAVKMDAVAETPGTVSSSGTNTNHTNLLKCKKLFFTMAQKTSKNHLLFNS